MQFWHKAVIVGVIGVYYFSKLKKWAPMDKAAPFLVLFHETEAKEGLPKNLLVRVAEQESHYDPKAYNSGSDARGMMQIVPRWHPEISDPFDPNEAIPYAGAYLRKLHDVYGYWDLALAAYNWGRGNVSKLIEKHGVHGFDHMPRETKNYVREILNDVSVS